MLDANAQILVRVKGTRTVFHKKFVVHRTSNRPTS